jgi:cytochrome c5
MFRTIPLTIAFLLAVSSCAVAALAADRLTAFQSVNPDLPFGDLAFPDGPGSEAINNNCLACHSAEMVLTQPPLTRTTWQAEVDKMRAAYKAPIAEEDVKAIVDYLARIRGAG